MSDMTQGHFNFRIRMVNLNHSFGTANQRLSGSAEFFQRFKLAAINRLGKFKISSKNKQSFEMNFENTNSSVKPTVYKILKFFLLQTLNVIVYIWNILEIKHLIV